MRSRWWVDALVIIWLCFLYDAITNLAPLRERIALSHAWGLLHLEQSLHLAPEQAMNLWLSAHRSLGLLISDYYDNAHFVITIGLLAWLWWRRPHLYPPLRNSLVLVNVLGFIVFWLYPMTPPRMLVGAGFTDVVSATHAFGSFHTGALASEANQFAAMPSLHIAWAVWCMLVVWRVCARGWVRGLAVLHPCLTSVAVLATANHFLFDIFAGLVTLALAVALVRVAASWRPRLAWRSGRAQAPGLALGLRLAHRRGLSPSRRVDPKLSPNMESARD